MEGSTVNYERICGPCPSRVSPAVTKRDRTRSGVHGTHEYDGKSGEDNRYLYRVGRYSKSTKTKMRGGVEREPIDLKHIRWPCCSSVCIVIAIGNVNYIYLHDCIHCPAGTADEVFKCIHDNIISYAVRIL